MRSRSMMMSSMAAIVRRSEAMGCCSASRFRQFVSMRTLRSSMMSSASMISSASLTSERVNASTARAMASSTRLPRRSTSCYVSSRIRRKLSRPNEKGTSLLPSSARNATYSEAGSQRYNYRPARAVCKPCGATPYVRLRFPEAAAEGRADSELALRCDGAPMLLHDVFHDRKAESRARGDARARALDDVEPLEDVRQGRGRDTGPIVFDGELRVLRLAVDRHLDLAAAGHDAQRVVEQVDDDLD